MATKKQKREAGARKAELEATTRKAQSLAALEASRTRELEAKGLITFRLKARSDQMEASLKAEIIARSERFGERVRIAEDTNRPGGRRIARKEWMEFLAGLTNSPHRSDAFAAYNNSYSGSDPILEDVDEIKKLHDALVIGGFFDFETKEK